MNTDNNLQGEAHGSVIASLVVFDVLDFMTWLVRLENTIDMHISQSRAIGYFSFRVGLLYNTGLPNKRYSHNVNTHEEYQEKANCFEEECCGAMSNHIPIN